MPSRINRAIKCTSAFIEIIHLFQIHSCTKMSRQHNKPKIPSSRLIQKKQNKDNLGYSGQTQFNNLENCSVEQLREKAKQLRKRFNQKQLEVMSAQKAYRMEVFKNQNAKSRVAQSDKYCELVRMKMAAKFINQYKGNKDSPLFYNENGLSPFELMLLQYNRYQTCEGLICMICYLDIQPNSHTALLPCQHLFHRECAVSHLLYSKSCPACLKEIFFQLTKEQKMTKKQ